MSANGNIMHTQQELRSISEMSMRYHSHRFRFLNRVHRIMMFLAAVAGGMAFYDTVFPSIGFSTRWLGAVSVLLVLIEFVFDIQGSRALYQNLYQRFAYFLGEITSTPGKNKNLRRWNRYLHDLHADEPPVFRVLNDHVHNEVAIRFGKEDEIVPICIFHRILKNVFPFPGYDQKKAKAKGDSVEKPPTNRSH